MRFSAAARFVAACCGLAASLLLAPGLATPALAQRVALVIGASAYQHVPPLPNAVHDAADLAATLRGLDFRVDLVLDPDRAAMESAVERFGQAARGAEAALFFYAGHALELGGRNWLIPVSAELRSPQQLRFQALELEAVTEQSQAAARVSLIMLDACRDNPFRQRWPAATRSAAGQGLSRVSPATGTLVVFSTAPGAVAEDGQGRNSPFTAALLRHLPTPGLEIRPMLAEVRRSVREATGGAQIPWEESSLEGSFFFRPEAPAAPPPAPALAAPPPPPPPGNDALAWQFVLNSRNPADFEVFVRQFPDSIFAPFARNRLAELRAAPAPAAPEPAPPARIAALPAPPPPATAPADPNRPLTRAEAQEAQRLLAAMGFDAGPADGAIGQRSREALAAFALAADLPAGTGFTLAVLERLRGPAPPAERRRAALAALAPPAPAIPPPATPPATPSPAASRAAPPAAAPAAPIVPEGPVAFRCPPAGLRVTYADGSVWLSRGAAPGDPEVCLSRSEGHEARLLFNLYPLPASDEAAIRAGMRALFPAAPGRRSDFVFFASAWGGGASQFRQGWRVVRREALEVEGQPRPSLVLERRHEGMFNNRHLSVETYWWDIATGAWLRREVAVVRLQSSARPFLAVRVEGR
jgi:hypothetical protein